MTQQTHFVEINSDNDFTHIALSQRIPHHIFLQLPHAGTVQKIRAHWTFNPAKSTPILQQASYIVSNTAEFTYKQQTNTWSYMSTAKKHYTCRYIINHTGQTVKEDFNEAKTENTTPPTSSIKPPRGKQKQLKNRKHRHGEKYRNTQTNTPTHTTQQIPHMEKHS